MKQGEKKNQEIHSWENRNKAEETEEEDIGRTEQCILIQSLNKFYQMPSVQQVPY